MILIIEIHIFYVVLLYIAAMTIFRITEAAQRPEFSVTRTGKLY